MGFLIQAADLAKAQRRKGRQGETPTTMAPFNSQRPYGRQRKLALCEGFAERNPRFDLDVRPRRSSSHDQDLITLRKTTFEREPQVPCVFARSSCDHSCSSLLDKDRRIYVYTPILDVFTSILQEKTCCHCDDLLRLGNSLLDESDFWVELMGFEYYSGGRGGKS